MHMTDLDGKELLVRLRTLSRSLQKVAAGDDQGARELYMDARRLESFLDRILESRPSLGDLVSVFDLCGHVEDG